MFKFISIFITIILIIALQLGFLPGLSPNLNLLINIPLLFILLLTFFSDFETSLSTALLLGFFLDLYSEFFFGFFIILLAIQVLMIKFLTLHLLPNKKLRSLLILNLIAISTWQLIYFLTLMIANKFNNITPVNPLTFGYLAFSFYQFLIHSFLLIITFKFFPRFKSNFSTGLVS